MTQGTFEHLVLCWGELSLVDRVVPFSTVAVV